MWHTASFPQTFYTTSTRDLWNLSIGSMEEIKDLAPLNLREYWQAGNKAWAQRRGSTLHRAPHGAVGQKPQT